MLGVIVSRFHASKQRAKSIRQTDINNNFKLYHEHKKLFSDVFDTGEIDLYLEDVRVPSIE
jgi:hypothetical protein